MAEARADGKTCHPLIIPKHYRNLPYLRGINGEEVQDEGFNLANARRRSNSSSYTAGLKDFKTKFETVEREPVFEEDIHGAMDDDLRRVTTESTDGSVDDDDKAKSV